MVNKLPAEAEKSHPDHESDDDDDDDDGNDDKPTPAVILISGRLSDRADLWRVLQSPERRRRRRQQQRQQEARLRLSGH